MSNTFVISVLRANVGKSAAQRSLFLGQLVHFIVEVSGEAVFAGSATSSDASTPGRSSFRRRLQKHEPPSRKESGQIIIRALKTQQQCKTLFYHYRFNRSDEVPEPLRGFYTSKFYTWDSRAMRPVSASAGRKPASSAGLHFPIVAAVDSGPKDVVQPPIDNDVAETEVAARPFDRQTYKSEKVWLTTFQVGRVQNHLRAISQKHEDDLLQSLLASKYQHGAGLMNVASPSPRKLGAVDADSML